MPSNLTVDQWGIVLITWIPNGVEALVFETLGLSITPSRRKIQSVVQTISHL